VTHFLQDILRQPKELRHTIEHLCGAGHRDLQVAADAIRKARHVYLTGMGSSLHAAFCAAPIFQQAAHPVHLQDASELLEFSAFPPYSVVIAVSRSGRSIEIVHLLKKARDSGATVIGLTNSPDGPLAREAQISVVVPIQMDHAISVNTYSTLATTAAALATATVGSFDEELGASLVAVLAKAEDKLAGYQDQIAESGWLASGTSTYFLARGASLGSCHEARLLWEEGAKSPATAMGSGGFRHGPQEMVNSDARFGMWIDGQRKRAQDLSVARDLKRLGAFVMLIGQDLPADAADLVFQLPKVRSEWQFLIDIIPAQLAAEALARRNGVDCDAFRVCSYIVEDEFGLISEEVASPKSET
jgi:glutamine---fructose-6-phosphate transaminase (isomerizing)